MFDDNDPLFVTKTRGLPAERALGGLLLAMLVVTVVLHAVQ